MRKTTGAIGWGKSHGAHVSKTAAHHAHRQHMKTSKSGLKNFSKTKGPAKGIQMGQISGVGERGWTNG